MSAEAEFMSRIRPRRHELGMSAAELSAELRARGLRCSQQQLNLLENGRRGLRLDIAVEIADALSMPLFECNGESE